MLSVLLKNIIHVIVQVNSAETVFHRYDWDILKADFRASPLIYTFIHHKGRTNKRMRQTGRQINTTSKHTSWLTHETN